MELWERVRRECTLEESFQFLFSPFLIRISVPELRVYPMFDRPIGPHPIGMFEVNLFTPAQFGAFIPWLVVNRGPLSALVHPNTGDDVKDHTLLATWMGQPFPLQVGLLRELAKTKAASEADATQTEKQA